MRVIESVWREKRQFLRAIAASASVDPGAAEDILQEAFVRMLESPHDFKDSTGACRFLCRIITNIAIDKRRIHHRRQHFARGHPSTMALWLVHGGKETFWNDLDPLRRLVGGEREILMEKLMHEIRLVLKRLPHKQKEAIHLMLLQEEVTLKDACREKGIPYSTLRSRMKKGVDRIRACLRDRGYLSPSPDNP